MNYNHYQLRDDLTLGIVYLVGTFLLFLLETIESVSEVDWGALGSIWLWTFFGFEIHIYFLYNY